MPIDREAYARLVREYRPRAQAYAHALTRRPDVAEDVAQDALIAAFLELPNLKNPNAFWPWLRAIVFKQADRWRRSNREVLELPEQIQAAQTPQEDPFEALPEEQAQPAVLALVYGYSQGEIAEILDLPVTTVNNRIHAAKKKIRETEYRRPYTDEDEFLARVQLCQASIEGDTPIVRRILADRPELVRARGEVQDEHMRKIACHDGWTPLHLAAHYGHLEIVQALFAAEADPEAIAKNPIRNTPLCAAAFGNRLEIVDWMLKNGVKVDTPNGWGHTALHRAATLGREEMCALLVQHGADRLAKTPEGQTASELAFALGFRRLAMSLVQRL